MFVLYPIQRQRLIFFYETFHLIQSQKKETFWSSWEESPKSIALPAFHSQEIQYLWITGRSEREVLPVVFLGKHRYKIFLPKFMCAHAYAESCKSGLYCTLATGVVYLSITMISKYIKKKKKVGGTVGSTDNLQILFVQKEIEVRRNT